MKSSKAIKKEGLLSQEMRPSEEAVVMPVPAKATPKTKTSKRGRKKASFAKEVPYRPYLRRVLKDVHPDLKLHRTTIRVLNSFVTDIEERLSLEAKKCRQMAKRRTLSSRDIQTSVRLLIPGELCKHAVSEGTMALHRYRASEPAEPRTTAKMTVTKAPAPIV